MNFDPKKELVHEFAKAAVIALGTGLAGWAVEGLKRVDGRNRFSAPPRAEERAKTETS